LQLKTRREPLSISLRAFVTRAKQEPKRRQRTSAGPSEYVLVFDTETTTDPSQRLRFGCYQFWKGNTLIEGGLFFHPSLPETEHALLATFAHSRGLKCMTKAAFVDNVFYGLAYDLRATIVGFNLPFDLSRLAVRHNPARGKMRGGFSFQLSEDMRKARVQIKHISGRASLIQFAALRKRRDTKGDRREGQRVPVRRGWFVDLKTVAAALFSRSFSLASLADFLKTQTRKASTDEHGGPLTSDYLDYAAQDVEVTWECFCDLSLRYDKHNLSLTHLSRILSEASIGKAYLKQMKIRPWMELQPNVPKEIIGAVMSTYFGGRAEVHIRRIITQVLYCDFLSMYPTVCTLMGLWKFVIAMGMRWRDATCETIEFLDRVVLADLQKPETWPLLTTLVEIEPDDDILPVRAKYWAEEQATIGLNYVSSDQPLWFALADCVASKTLTRRSPKIVKALRFSPGERQDDLKPISIFGNEAYTVDPLGNDLYKRLIDLREVVKARRDNACGEEKDAFDAEQKSLKIVANATSYGIFVELIVEQFDETESRLCFGSGNGGFPVEVDKAETPGRYFHPLLATLITGAARLMLAITERLISDAGLDWAFCDTDSMAIAKPVGMDQETFVAKAKSIIDWFTPLNPYETKGPLLKIEDANYAIGSEALAPLYCLAISSKRYVLFNIDEQGQPVLRKASAHGLGHLLASYRPKEAPPDIPAPAVPLPKIGVERWQYDLWFQIIRAVLDGHPEQVDLSYHPALQLPAMSRYSVTTPALERWFQHHNANRPYEDRVKPFNFISGFQASPAIGEETFIIGNSSPRRKKQRSLRPIAPYTERSEEASVRAFDRETGKTIPAGQLKTYAQSLAQYHLRPEAKFENGDYLDSGTTCRRHVQVAQINYIGKEANRWEEQFFLGMDEDAVIEYGPDPNAAALLDRLMAAIGKFGKPQVASRAGVSRNSLTKFLDAKCHNLPPRLSQKIGMAIAALNLEASEEKTLLELARIEAANIGLSEFARRLQVDASNLGKVVDGKRKFSSQLAARVDGYFKNHPAD
jgi:hypothetical protein